jgi:hypothetical protein
MSFLILFEKWRLKYTQLNLPLEYYSKHNIDPTSVCLLQIWK